VLKYYREHVIVYVLDVAFNFIAVPGFAKSGSAADLYEKYGLSANQIVKKLNLSVK